MGNFFVPYFLVIHTEIVLINDSCFLYVFVFCSTTVRFMYCMLQLDVYHPALFRCYIRKNDMDEPPPLEDGSSYGQKDFHKDLISKRT
jgi:hypothetical protein